MKSILTYLFVVLALVNTSCKSGKGGNSGKVAKPGTEVDPGDVKPKVDTRFQEKFFEAQLEKSKNNYDKAYASFEACLALSPQNGAVHYELGRFDLQTKGNPEGALAHAKAAVASDVKNPWYQMLLGDVYMSMENFEMAAKSYKLVAELNPSDPYILEQKARAQVYAGQIKEALATCDEIEKMNGPYEELSMWQHELWLSLNQPEKAGLEIENLAKSFPDEPRYWGIAAQFYARNGMPEKAQKAMEEMVKSDPDNGQVHYQLSEFYAANGDDRKSYEELKKAFETVDISIDQKVGVLLKYFSLTDFNQTYLPQAYELLNLTESLHPGEAKSYSIYGDFLFREGRDEEALQKYRKAVELDPSKSVIWEQIISIDNSLNDFDNMATESAKALELFPSIPEFYYFNGIANYKKKQNQQAIESLLIGKELVIENDGLLSQFYSALGEIYHYQNDHVKSDENYNKALKYQSENVYVLNNYAYYLSLRKTRLDQAAEMALKANTIAPGQPSFEDTYAWILFCQENYNEALIWIEKAISHSEESAELSEHYGDILFKLNRTSEAVSKWKEAKQLGGNSSKLDQKINEQKYID
ncbi:MAG: tetratricopeptide repeat protein [Flavobacteriales bacterium]